METTKPSQPWAGDPTRSEFKMIDVSGKPTTRRRAVARGKIFLAPAAFVAVKNGTNPKGNVLAMAEVAGILGAKRTADALPLCHPLPLQSVRLSFELLSAENAILAQCEAITEAQTGVEMEALAGVNGALLSIYDLSKAVDPVISLGEIRLDLKEGGKSGVWRHPDFMPKEAEPKDLELPLEGVQASVITVSDRGHAGKSEDRSGPEIRRILQTWGARVLSVEIVPDERKQIQSAVRAQIENKSTLVFTTGGTGLSPRDVTPESLTEIADRVIPGIGECLRQSGARHIDTAWLSRSIGVQIARSWVIALPGSTRAVGEGLDALKPLLAHGIHTLQGGDHS